MDYELWIKQAESDLKKAEILFKGEEFDGSVFYSQQSAEKSLKSLIIFLEDQLIKTHDLLLLGKKVKLPEKLLMKVVLLNPYYTSSRYPISINIKINKSESREAIGYAREVLEWCREEIKISK